jgi:tRNA pseudouridine55 synthase
MTLSGSDFENGQVLLIDKPLEWTSFDVVNFIRSFLRKIYNLKKLKVGHAGTLDPLATGLLIICTGKKTKEIERFMGMDKTYTGSMYLGATTPSYDAETAIDNEFDITGITDEQLITATKQFNGLIDQVPPAYSAIKVKGKRAFDMARKNKDVQLRSRKVNIINFELLSIGLPNIDFVVECSKGTYVRSLVHDFGISLGKGAYLTDLRRTSIGDYKLTDALTIEEFKQYVLETQAGQNPV